MEISETEEIWKCRKCPFATNGRMCTSNGKLWEVQRKAWEINGIVCMGDLSLHKKTGRRSFKKCPTYKMCIKLNI